MNTPWYESGLRFRCTQCGNCCVSRGEHSYLYVMPEEVTAIAAFLGMPETEFLEQCTQREDGWTIIRSERPECRFLGEEGGCTIYPVRPRQCASWPFWEENLRQPIWESSVLPTCPGAGQGELHSAAEVERIARENEEWYLRDV